MEKKYNVTTSPHIRTAETVDSVMIDVIVALMPALIMAIYFFRWDAMRVVAISVITALLTEAISQIIMKKEIEVLDGSAVVTGILFAFMLSPLIPWWQVVIGAVVSIIIGKIIFGGLGQNVFNPALVGRAFLMTSWPVAMTHWIHPDGVVGATVLGTLRNDGAAKVLEMFDGNRVQMYWGMFFGSKAGSIGETSILFLLVGAAYLLYKKQISWHTPVIYLGTVFVLALVFKQDPILHILSGGLVLGAFFMATDPVTTPYTFRGKVLFGVGAGILTMWIRMKGIYPEGVCYAILVMNMVTPLINKYTVPKVFGEAGKNG